jgi:hypothetical protein
VACKIVSVLLPLSARHNNDRVIFMHRPLDELLASQNRMLSARGESAGAP